jgi:hypothetical protein
VKLAELGDLGQELDVALEAMLVHLLDGHGLKRTNERINIHTIRCAP